MNIKALIKSLFLRKFSTGLLLLQLALTLGLIINSTILALDTKANLAKDTGLPLDEMLVVVSSSTSGAFKETSYAASITEEDLAKIEQIPGVIAAAPSVQLPIQTGGWNGNVNDVDDPEAVQRNRYLKFVAKFHSNEKLAEIFNLKLIEGRYLNESDKTPLFSEDEMNIVITESLKKALYPEQSAIGKLTNAGRIVGVVEDFIINPGLPDDTQYGVFTNMPVTLAEFVQHYIIRVEPKQLNQVKAQLKDVILGVQPERDIFGLFSMRDHMNDFYANDQGLVSLFVGLCVLMVAITAISSYAYAQFHITQQTKLIGIRRALGATKKDIILYVLTENWLVYLVGCAIGIAATIGFNILLSQYIELSKPTVTLAIAGIGILFVASTLATWLPAKKTSNIPPVIATRTV